MINCVKSARGSDCYPRLRLCVWDRSRGRRDSRDRRAGSRDRRASRDRGVGKYDDRDDRGRRGGDQRCAEPDFGSLNGQTF